MTAMTVDRDGSQRRRRDRRRRRADIEREFVERRRRIPMRCSLAPAPAVVHRTRSSRPGCTSSPRSSDRRRRPDARRTTASTSSRRPGLRGRRRGGDLRAVRAALVRWVRGRPAHAFARRSAIPVLAKEFIVDPRQLAVVRAAGADAVLLLAVLHPGKSSGCARSSDRALDLGLEPFVEAHDRRELDVAIAVARGSIGINNRDLRTLVVDTGRADRLRAFVPDDRIVIAESGVRDAATVARWRALGFDGALVGEALMRSSRIPTAAVRSFVAAGRQPDDPANRGRRPFVKICGITDAAGALRGRPCRCRCDRTQHRGRHAAGPRHARGGEPGRPRPRDRRRPIATGDRPRDGRRRGPTASQR